MSTDVHALAGAYVLDALPADEVESFRDHLSGCPTCQQDVAELQETAAQLGLAVALPPPQRLRADVLAAARQTRQVPPLLPAAAPPRHRARRWSRGLAAAAAVILIAAGGVSVLVWDSEEAPQSQVMRVLDAPDADIATARLTGGGTLTVVSSERRGQAVVLADDLPPLPRDRIYQLWLVGAGGSPRPTDVLLAGGRPGGSHLLSSVAPRDRIAVTSEPAGGSRQPTTTPLAVLSPG